MPNNNDILTALKSKPKGFVDDIETLTENNTNFRHVICTGKHLQLVLMTLKPNEDIGDEIHDETDQFFRIESGEGEVVINNKPTGVKAGTAILVPAGAKHNIINIGHEPLKFYTLYGPPKHRDGLIQRTKP
jgi:mannose-6-phosphate isomerase-like protein (cupin superfamily)